MKHLKNDYEVLQSSYNPHSFKRIVKHPLFGYVVMSLALIALQLLFMYTDLISLTVSRAINITMIYCIASMGLGILLMMSGLISLSTGVFIGLGSYIVGNLLKLLDMPFILFLIIVVGVGVVLGIVVGIISLRAQGIHLLIVTLALSYIMSSLYILPNPFTGGPNGFRDVPYPTLLFLFQTNRETMYFVVLAVMFLLIVVTLNIINSPTGRAFLAMSRSESLAQAMGIKLLKYRVLAFVIATVYAMLAGALYIASLTSSSASSWTSVLSMNILVAVILGGTAKPAGVLMGSAVMFGLNLAVLSNIEFFARNSTASSFFMGILIILIVMKYPGGLMWFLASVKNGVRKFFAQRRLNKYGPDET